MPWWDSRCLYDRKVVRRSRLILALAAFCVCFAATPAYGANDQGPQDRAFTVGPTVDVDGSTYDFDARSDPLGADATGRFFIQYSPFARTSGTVTCLQANGNTAVIAGVDEVGDIVGVGDYVTFTVQDNGLGGSGDLLSLAVPSPGGLCLPQVPFIPLSSGDIVVQDAQCQNPKDKPGTDKDRCKDKKP